MLIRKQNAIIEIFLDIEFFVKLCFKIEYYFWSICDIQILKNGNCLRTSFSLLCFKNVLFCFVWIHSLVWPLSAIVIRFEMINGIVSCVIPREIYVKDLENIFNILENKKKNQNKNTVFHIIYFILYVYFFFIFHVIIIFPL